MLLSQNVGHCIRIIRELEKTKQVKEYRQITQNQEVIEETARQMNENNWAAIKEELGLDKLYKYQKEDYIKEDLSEQYEQIRDRTSEINNITVEVDALKSYKRLFMELMSIEGDVEFQEDYYLEILADIKEEIGIGEEYEEEEE